MEERSKSKKSESANRVAMPSRDELVRTHRRDTIISLGTFIIVTVASFFFNELASDPMLNIAMLYTLGVFIITRYTDGYIYGLMFAVASVLSVNFFFTYPYQNFNFTLEGYQVTFLGMFLIAIVTSAMRTNMMELSSQRLELVIDLA